MTARASLPMRRSRRHVHRLLVVALATTLAATSSPAAATEELTGDITAPEIVVLELQPPSVDVTESAATLTVTARFTDGDTGVTGASLGWMSPAEDSHSYSTHFTRISGDESDGVYRASMSIPRSAAPGHWPLDVQVRDRVGNTRIARRAELERAGLPGYLDVASRNPDVTAPDIKALEVLPAQVDVRSGPAAVTVRVHAVDDAAGVDGIFVPPISPHDGNGGAQVPIMRLVSGTPTDGWWEGDISIAENAHAGTWSFAVRPRDVLANTHELTPDDLQARGMSPQFSVLSHEDVTPPSFTAAALSTIAVDVSDQDQQVGFTAQVTDAVTGVEDYSWGHSNVQLSLQHPLGQLVGQAGMLRTSGTAHDGAYAATLTFPRHSATGLWALHLSAADKIRNSGYVDPVQMAALGLPPAVLVYNTPLPPLDVVVDPGDASALVQWQPPTDERGAEVTEYVVRESPEGRSVKVPADRLSAVVPDLDNGIEHSFVVHAVNRAGESDPSQSVAAVPADGQTLPDSQTQPSPQPSSQPEPQPASASGFVPVSPDRLLDSRFGIGTTRGLKTGTVHLTLPSSRPAGATSVTLNVTTTGALRSGHVTAHAGGSAVPATSNLNFVPGTTSSNLVVVPIGPGGAVSLSVTGTTHLIADIQGFGVDGGFRASSPIRALDTRNAIGVGTTTPRLGSITLRAPSSVPDDATVLLMNVTITGATGAGFLSAGGAGTSAVNYVRGVTQPGLVPVRINSDRTLNLTVANAAAHVIADVQGFWTGGLSASPQRLLDTRNASGAPRVTGSVTLTLPPAPAGATSLLINLTAVNQTGTGHAVAYANGAAVPASSNLNWVRGRTQANLVVLAVPADGKLTLRVSSATHLVADLVAWQK